MNTNFTIPEDFCGDAPSPNSTQREFWELEQSSYGVATACFMLFYLLVGLPWNTLVAGTIVKRKLYQQPTIFLLLNLVLSDIVMLVTIVPLNVITGFAGEFILGISDKMRCEACNIGLITTWFSLMSLFTVTLMAVDRFLFIYRPLRYEKMVTQLRVVIALAAVWLLCSVIAIMPLFGFGSIGYFRPFVVCLVDFTISSNYYLGILILVACIPLVVLIICNMWVVCIVQKNIKAIYKVYRCLPNQQERHSHRKKLQNVVRRKRQMKQLHLMRVFGCLLGANVLSWLPIIIVALASFAIAIDDMPLAALVLVNILFLAQVAVHPALETALISDVKEPIKKLLRVCKCLCLSKASIDRNNRCFTCRPRLVESEEHPSSGFSGFLDMLLVALLPRELYTTSTDTATEDGMLENVTSSPRSPPALNLEVSVDL